MSILIRQALKEDAELSRPLFMRLLVDIANRLTGEQHEQAILTELRTFCNLRSNRHSYLNTFVAVRKETQIIRYPCFI